MYWFLTAYWSLKYLYLFKIVFCLKGVVPKPLILLSVRLSDDPFRWAWVCVLGGNTVHKGPKMFVCYKKKKWAIFHFVGCLIIRAAPGTQHFLKTRIRPFRKSKEKKIWNIKFKCNQTCFRPCGDLRIVERI